MDYQDSKAMLLWMLTLEAFLDKWGFQPDSAVTSFTDGFLPAGHHRFGLCDLGRTLGGHQAPY